MLSKKNKKRSERRRKQRRVGAGVMGLESREMLSADGLGLSLAATAAPTQQATQYSGPSIDYNPNTYEVNVNGTNGVDHVRVYKDYNGAGSADDEIVVELPELRWYLVVHRALRRVPRIVAVLDLLDELIREVTEGNWSALRA